MSRHVDISVGQATSLIGLLLVIQSHVLAPPVMAEYAHQDMWISVMLSIIMTLFLSAYTVWLTNRFPEYTLMQFSELVLGRFFGKLVGGVFFLYFMTITVIHVQLILQVFKTMFMPQTPALIFVVMILAFAYFCSIQGIGTLARMSTVLLIISYATIIFLFCSVLREVRFIHYLPLLQSDWSQIVHASLFTFASNGQVVVLTMLHPYLRHQTQKNSSASFIWWSFLTSLITGMLIMEFIGVFSSYQLQSLLFPTAEIDALIRIGEFFERPEMFFVTIWTSVILVATGFLFSIGYNSLIQLFNCSEGYRSRMLAAILVLLPSMMLQDFDRFSHFLHDAWVYWSIVCQAIFPFLLGLIYLVKKRFA